MAKQATHKAQVALGQIDHYLETLAWNGRPAEGKEMRNAAARNLRYWRREAKAAGYAGGTLGFKLPPRSRRQA